MKEKLFITPKTVGSFSQRQRAAAANIPLNNCCLRTFICKCFYEGKLCSHRYECKQLVMPNNYLVMIKSTKGKNKPSSA